MFVGDIVCSEDQPTVWDSLVVFGLQAFRIL